MTKSEGEKIHDIYECGTYSRSRHRVEQECSGHYVPTEAVRELILMTLRAVCPWAIQNKEEFAARVREESELRQQNAAKETKRLMASMKKRSGQPKTIIKPHKERRNGRTVSENTSRSARFSYLQKTKNEKETTL